MLLIKLLIFIELPNINLGDSFIFPAGQYFIFIQDLKPMNMIQVGFDLADYIRMSKPEPLQNHLPICVTQ